MSFNITANIIETIQATTNEITKSPHIEMTTESFKKVPLDML